MFYDLNVPWFASNTAQLPRTLAFLSELGYNVVALNHTIDGKLPQDLTSPIPPDEAIPHPSTLALLRRCTLTLTVPHQNARLASLAQTYDILALRPVDEKTLSLACTSLDCDIISLDLSQRLPFWLKMKPLAEAARGGKKIEICYAQALQGDNKEARRNLISNATQLIRATRGGRGIILSSEAKGVLGCRGPWDVVNLAAVWGLSQERGVEAVGKECRSCVVSAKLKRTSWRGVVDVVAGGEKPGVQGREKGQGAEGKGKQVNGQKRKAEVMEGSSAGAADGETTTGAEKPMSKRQMKKQAKEAKRQGLAQGTVEGGGGSNRAPDDNVEPPKANG